MFSYDKSTYQHDENVDSEKSVMSLFHQITNHSELLRLR